jgi:CubicO group peptidase (beta-lactamase class C family)
MRPNNPIILAGSCAATLLLGACTADDESRPGFPRTSRTPIASAPFPYAAPENVGLSSDAIWWLKERLYSRVVARRVIGLEILVLKDRRIVLHQAMGWADRDELVPLERNSVFRIASMTKPFTGTAALLMVDDGRLTLDDRVADHLPSFDSRPSASITVRQLLTHRSGFVQGGQPPGYAASPSLLDAVRLAGEAGPDFPPGDRFIYSNLNSEALGALVETVSGVSVEDLLAERVLAPLGLSDTHVRFAPGATWTSRVPSSFRQWGAGRWERAWSAARARPETWFSPAGDLYSTAFDYARFIAAWMDRGRHDGGRLLSASLVDSALADPAPDAAGGPRNRFYGMHWEIYAPPPAPGTLPVFGHRGATGTLGMAIPETDAIVICLTNSGDTEVVDEVIEAALELFGAPSR